MPSRRVLYLETRHFLAKTAADRTLSAILSAQAICECVRRSEACVWHWNFFTRTADVGALLK
jgi:hypothetical protein